MYLDQIIMRCSCRPQTPICIIVINIKYNFFERFSRQICLLFLYIFVFTTQGIREFTNLLPCWQWFVVCVVNIIADKTSVCVNHRTILCSSYCTVLVLSIVYGHPLLRWVDWLEYWWVTSVYLCLFGVLLCDYSCINDSLFRLADSVKRQLAALYYTSYCLISCYFVWCDIGF
jgi:hypothetical protein